MRLVLAAAFALGLLPVAAFAGDPYDDGMAAFGAERYGQAGQLFQEALRRRPGFAPYNYMLGMSWLRAGQGEDAAVAFEAVVTGGSGADEGLRLKAWVNLLRVLVDLGRNERIEEIATGIGKDVPRTAEVLNQVGRARHNAGNFAGAIEVLVQATALATDNWNIFNNLGLAYLSQGNLNGARIAFERAAELSPRLPFVQNNLGSTYEALGQLDAAAQAYNRALDADPAYKKARSALARVQRLRARSLPKSYVQE